MDLKMNYTIEKVLIIEYTSLPENVRNEICFWNEFGNNRYLLFFSELEKITLENYNRFLSNEDNKYENSLTIEKFLIDSEIDLSGINVILFHVSW